MRAVVLAIACAAAGACYQQPSLASCKYQCGGANNDACPNGYSCNAGMCVAPGESCDGDGGVIDAPPNDDATDGPVVCADPAAFQLNIHDAVDTNTSLKEVVVVDINRDQILDLVVRDSSSSIGVFFGIGGGAFNNIRQPVQVSNAKRILAGNWNHDTLPGDLLVLTSTSLEVVTWDGSSFATSTFLLPSGTGTGDVANIGDIDTDGFDDIAVYYTTMAGTPSVVPYAQDPTFRFSSGTGRSSVQGSALIAGDVTGEGLPDVFVMMNGMNQFGMHKGALPGGGTFGFDAALSTNVNLGPVDGVVGLVHASGERSVITASSNANTVSIRRYNGTTTSFGGNVNPAVGMKPVSVILANIGGNALPDIVTANDMDDTVSILINIDGDNWMPKQTLGVGNHPVDVVSADFNGDMRADLAVAAAGNTSRVDVFLNQCPP